MGTSGRLAPVNRAVTLSGTPLAMRAGIETLKRLALDGFYDSLDRKAKILADGMRQALSDSGIAGQVARAGSLLTLFFTVDPVENYSAAKRTDTRRFASFFQEMLCRKYLLPPSQFEALFVSAAHSDDDIRRTVVACRESLAAIWS